MIPDLNPLLTPSEVADKLRIDVRSVYVLLRSGVLPHLDLGYRTKRIRATDFEAYLRAGEVETKYGAHRKAVFTQLNLALNDGDLGRAKVINAASTWLGCFILDKETGSGGIVHSSGAARHHLYCFKNKYPRHWNSCLGAALSTLVAEEALAAEANAHASK